jgi:hypothetical protein
MRHYGLYSWSAQYRQEWLHDVRTTHLEGRLRKGHKSRYGRDSVGLALASVLSLVRGA